MNSLNSEVNRLYNLFCEKNQYFKQNNGLVSFVAHSLGSVIVYDILTSYNSAIQLFNSYGEDANQVILYLFILFFARNNLISFHY